MDILVSLAFFFPFGAHRTELSNLEQEIVKLKKELICKDETLNAAHKELAVLRTTNEVSNSMFALLLN